MSPRFLLIAAVLLACLDLALASTAPRGRRGRGQARRRGGSGAVRRKGSGSVVGRGRLAASSSDDGAVIFIDSYRSTQERESSYNVLPGKKGACEYRGIAMFDKAVWSPKPCITCMCTSGEVICDEVACPHLHCVFSVTPPGECCPVCTDLVPDVPELSGDSPVPNDPSEPDTGGVSLRTQDEIDELLRREEEDHREEEEALQKKDAERKKKRKEKKLEVEKQRRLQEENLREEEELRVKEEEERQRQEAERRREEEEEAAAAEERRRRTEEEKRREEDRRQQLVAEQQKLLREVEEAEEEEQEVWLRGDVFEMPPQGSIEEEVMPLQAPSNEEEEGVAPSLPSACTITGTTISCENAKLTRIPPLSIPELKELSLEGNAITTIPAEAFNGIPNLERINLGKNKFTSAGIHPQAFKRLKHLTRLYMDGNLLEQIPAELPSSLQELKVNENNLRGIDEDSLQDLSNLVTLELEGNLLSEGNVDPLAFQPLRQLSYLRLGRNHFRTIPQGLPGNLQEVYLENNLIEEISEAAFNRSTNLNVVVLRHNKLDETRIAPLAWINHKNLESIDLSYNSLYLVPSFLPRSLVHLVLVGNQVERIPGYVFAHMSPGLEYLYLSFNKVDNAGIDPVSFFGAYDSLTELFLDHNQLTSIPHGISDMRSLHFLRLNDNKIRNFEEEAICDPQNEEDSSLVTLRLENNFIDTRKISPTSFSCIISYSSIVLKPQKVK